MPDLDPVAVVLGTVAAFVLGFVYYFNLAAWRATRDARPASS
ncbi:hypothetical protein [Jiangella asiatica]|nr:hypothetical protein [Jiangella asiatica]